MEITLEQKILVDKVSKIGDIDFQFRSKKEELFSLLFEIEIQKKNIENREQELDNKAQQHTLRLKKIEEELQIIISEKSKSFPWLAKTISEYLLLQDSEISNYLKQKKNPAPNASESVKQIALEKKILTEQLLQTKYKIQYYESLFPFLSEFDDENIDEQLLKIAQGQNTEIDVEDDPVKKFLTDAEYKTLTPADRNQRALERYLQSNKSNWQIGRDYERYIGYLYELDGYKVTYFGIQEKFEDLGRDLICSKDEKTFIIQCKNWSKHKTVNEKHINQLFGTTVKFYIDYFDIQNKETLAFFPQFLKDQNIVPLLITSTKLSEKAKLFAKALGVNYIEDKVMKEYPTIKCHVNKQTKEKIYHLPFDQMYDRTILEKRHGEFYAFTVQQAETKGFRRAWKWRG